MGSRWIIIGLLLCRLGDTQAASPAASPPASQATPATIAASTPPASDYRTSFQALYRHLGRTYPGFPLKDIDWATVGAEMLPQADGVTSDEEFGLLCLRLVARLQDAHAHLLPGSARVPELPLPKWDPGLACLMDDRNRPVVYHLDAGGPADRSGVRVGSTIITVDGEPAAAAIEAYTRALSTYIGYSSDRHLIYDATRGFLRRPKRGQNVRLELQEPSGETRTVELTATLPVRYLPRLPVPIPGIRDGADFSYTRLNDELGYVYIRRIRPDLPEDLDRALAALNDTRGLIIDLRGNSGGGFDGARAVRSFNLDDGNEPLRPRYTGGIAMLIDGRCMSAGEGWGSWFVATRRARLFGTATAGASARKETYTLPGGKYRVIAPVKLYKGFLARPIERRGLEPDVPVRNNAADLAAGKDTVLEAARRYLLASQPAPG